MAAQGGVSTGDFDEFEISSAFTGGFPQETLEDVQKLQERGHRIRSKGGLFLGAAAVATAISVFALVLYHQAEPSTAFTVIDVPLLNEVLSKTTPTGVASTLNAPFPSAANQLIGMMEGTFGKTIAIIALMMGLAMGLISQNLMSAVSGIMHHDSHELLLHADHHEVNVADSAARKQRTSGCRRR